MRARAVARRTAAAALAALALPAAAGAQEPPAPAEPPPAPQAVRLPAVAQVAAADAWARRRPSGRARAIVRLRPLRWDGRPQVVLAVGARTDRKGRLWYRVRLPVRPNGTTGWIPAARLSVRHVRTRIEIRRGERTLTVRRGRRVLLRATVAVGAPGSPTPVGSFYVAARFRPALPYLGAYAIETSAFSHLSDWPGGGVVGLHGTDQPWLLGQAVSHGCVRMADADVLRLRRLAPLGAPVRIRA